MQVFKTNINTGVTTTGTAFSPLFPSDYLPRTVLFEYGDDIYFKTIYNLDVYYYKISSDLSNVTLVGIEGGNYHKDLPANIANGLSFDYDSVSKIIRVFKL